MPTPRLQNWNGNVADGVKRPPVQLICADGAPCYSITLSNVNMWSQTDQAVVKCESAYGSGVACIRNSGSHTSYAIVAALIAMDTPRQIGWHLSNCRRGGATFEEVKSVREICIKIAGACGITWRNGVPEVKDE